MQPGRRAVTLFESDDAMSFGSPQSRRILLGDLDVAARSNRTIALIAALTVAYGAAIVSSAVPSRWFAVAALAVVALLEYLVPPRAPMLSWGLGHAGMTGIARGLLRGAAVVLLAGRLAPASVLVTATVAIAVAATARTLLATALEVADYLAVPPVRTRGLPPLPMTVPRLTWPRRLLGPDVALLDLLAVAAVAGVPLIGRNAAVALLVVTAAVPVAATTVAARFILRARRQKLTSHILAAIDQVLLDAAPELIVYFGSSAEWTYQLDVWLEPLARVRRRVLLVVRDPAVLDELAPSDLPVIAVPRASTLMRLGLPTARAALYVGNTANNIHLMRRPELTSVFIGHGDSDKAASANPFTRAYREVWVAGPAGRDRYVAAGIGVPPEAFVEIGRPQLDNLDRVPDAVPRLTVLYAPTWEGFGESEHQSSVPDMGPAIVAELLRRRGIRVMYRPHPRIGHRSAAARRAHQQIMTMLAEHGALTFGAAAPGAPGNTDSVDPWAYPGHRIVPHAGAVGASLVDTFRHADVLIADVSSVITDFLAADRPFAVTNPGGMPKGAFRLRYRTAAGGYLLGPDLAQLDAVLAAGAGEPDPTATARKDAADYVLGPRPADPVQPFVAAVDRVCAMPPSGSASPLLPEYGVRSRA